jgi:GT2 family glycosyltransferase
MRADVTDPPRLGVSIVNWRAAGLAIECLRSIATEIDTLTGCHVYIVDNASGDGSDAAIEKAIRDEGWGRWATLIRSAENRGFAAGNNIAIRRALESNEQFDYVLLLNPDTIVRKGAFQTLLEFMEVNPEVGIAGGRSEDLDATPQCCSFKFPNPISECSMYLQSGLFERLFRRFLTPVPIPEHALPVDWVSGAHMMIRRAVFDDIGLMDEGYFLYYEETDFTLRARRAGWTCWHVPESRIVHLVGQSSGVTTREGPVVRRPPYWFESRRRYFVMNHGRIYAAITDCCVVAACTVRRLISAVKRRRSSFPPHFVSDLLRHSALRKGNQGLSMRQTSP